MSVLLTSLIAAASFGLFFFLLSILGKREDYMLDDYTEDDKPDNVRIIERDLLKIVEKPVEVEVEKAVRDTEEEDRLKGKIEEISNSKKLMEEELVDKNNYIKSILKDLSDLGEKHDKEKDKYTKDKQEYESELNKAISDNKLLKSENESIVKDAEKFKRSSNERVDKIKGIVDKLKKENSTLMSKIKKLTKEIEKEDKLIKDKDDEISKEKDNIDKLVRDRDYFIDLVEKQKKEIEKLKNSNSIESYRRPNIYEGVDDYGKFYDISIVSDRFPKPHVQIIEDVIGNIDTDQFAYYSINTTTGYKNLSIHHINTLPSFIERVQRKKTDGKYKVYIILDNRVYYYEVY